MPRGDAGRRRCAIYTRKSSEEGLEQEFNSLAAQREACEAFIRSQRDEGWVLARTRYDDGGFSGGNIERPALQGLLADIRAGRIDVVVVYKVDRLGLRTKCSTTGNGTKRGGRPFSRGHLYGLLSNPIYTGQIAHKNELYAGQHPALITNETWTAVRDRLAANAGDHRRKAKGA